MVEISSAANRLNQLVSDIRVAILTTVQSDGTLHSCPMMTLPIGADEVLWFLSEAHTGKVDAVQHERNVSVSYADPASGRYVSISGICQVVRDHEKAKELWTPVLEQWFPSGVDDPDLLLLKVHVLQAEYWDTAEGRMVEVSGLKRFAGATGHAVVVPPEDLNR